MATVFAMRPIYRRPGRRNPLPRIRHNSSAPRQLCAAAGPAWFAGMTNMSHATSSTPMKAVIDFSYAAFVAAVIGIAVGGTAFSLVWLMHILKVEQDAEGWWLAARRTS